MKLKEYINYCESKASELELEKDAIKYIIKNIFFPNDNLYYDALNCDIDLNKYNYYLNQYLIDKKPAQYIVGFTYFWGCKIIVNSDVLIPRKETEILVEEALKIIKDNNYKNIIDIGTGSGAIAIAISKNFEITKSFMTKLSILATDISIKALEIAKNNAIINDVDISFEQADLFPLNVDNKFDMIISNPPYISYNEINEVSSIVLDNEPQLALFARDDGLEFYKKILKESKKYLRNKGHIVFEIGYKQAKAISSFAKSIYKDCNIKVIKDYNNLDRIIIIELKQVKK